MKEDKEEIALYNTAGALVYFRNTPTQTIDMSMLSQGMYTAQIKLSSSILGHRKMMKM